MTKKRRTLPAGLVGLLLGSCLAIAAAQNTQPSRLDNEPGEAAL